MLVIYKKIRKRINGLNSFVLFFSDYSHAILQCLALHSATEPQLNFNWGSIHFHLLWQYITEYDRHNSFSLLLC